MSITKVGLFLLFLLVYAVSLFVQFWLSQRLIKKTLDGQGALLGVLSAAAVFLMFFAIFWILGGRYEPVKLGLVILLSIASTVLAELLWFFKGLPGFNWGPWGSWAGGEFGTKHPLIVGANMAISIGVVVWFPVYIGYRFFQAPLFSQEFARWLFRGLSVYVLASIASTLPITTGVLVSVAIPEEARNRFVIAQISAVVLNVLALSLVMWSFSCAGPGTPVQIGSISVTIYLRVILVACVFHLLAHILPYLAGFERARKWRAELRNHHGALLGEITDTLDFVNPAEILRRLQEIKAKIETEMAAFIRRDSVFELANRLENGNLARGEQHLAAAYQQVRDKDPRFVHLFNLQQLGEQIEGASVRLTGGGDVRDSMRQLAEGFRKRKQDSEASETKRTPEIWVLLTVLAGPIASPIVTKLAEGIRNLLIGK
jgi:hypothetical protein